MTSQPTLYKIQRDTVEGLSINVESKIAKVSNQPHLLFCGGFHSTMQGTKASFLSGLCAVNGWGFTRFDYLGHGQSDGLAENFTLHEWLDDTLAVIDSLPGKITLIGSSMGAWLAVHAALQRPEKMKALITIAAAPDFTEKLLLPALNHDQQFNVQLGQQITIATEYEGEDWRVNSGLFESGRDLALLNSDTPLGISVPIRMLHGTKDTDVPWTLSQELLELFSLSSDATLTLIAGADHRLSDPVSLNHLASALDSLVA